MTIFRSKTLELNCSQNVVIRQEEKIKALESKLESSRSKDSKANIILYGLDEILEETEEVEVGTENGSERSNETRDKLIEKVKEFF